MQFAKSVPVEWIASFINARLLGNKNGLVTGINEIHKVREGDIVFVDHPKYYEKCLQSAATFIIINKETEIPEGKALLVVDDPFAAVQVGFDLRDRLAGEDSAPDFDARSLAHADLGVLRSSR